MKKRVFCIFCAAAGVFALTLIHTTITWAHDNVIVVPLSGAVGDATPSDVTQGTTFSSKEGKGLTGSRPPAPVAKTGQTTTYAFGDDGKQNKGVAWPVIRFTDNSDGTVTDNLTGLVWLKNGDCFGFITWSDSIALAVALMDGQCGLTDGSSTGDWRLSNIREFLSLIDYSRMVPALPLGHPSTNVRTSGYWTSTTFSGVTTSAFTVLGDSGEVNFNAKTETHSSWPVRGGNN